MKPSKFLMLLMVFVVVLALQVLPAYAVRYVGPYVRIYEGIEYAEGSDDVPRLQKVFVVRADLQNPYVGLYVSHDNGGSPYEVTLEPSTTFLANHGCKVAVNGSFFNASLSPNTDIWGLTVSNGTVVSAPDYAAPFNSQLSFTSSNVPSITVGNTIPPGCFNALAGAEIILSNGAIVSGNPDIHPRTFAGLSADNRYLILICVDGRQAGWSMGVNHPEAAQWLLDFGAWNGLMLDGGGSTSMVRADVGVVNRPCYGYVRSVANHLGVLSNNPDIVIDNPQGTCSANWATSTGSSQKWGADYRWRSTQAISDPFIWRPNILTAGNYEVYVWYPAGSNRSPQAPFTVSYNGGSANIAVNEQINGGTWVSLGVYPFAAGTSGYVRLSCWAPTGYVVVADAVRFYKR